MLAHPPLDGRDLTPEVAGPARSLGHRGPRVVAIDCGIKRSIVDGLVAAGCRLEILPAGVSAERIRALDPDAVFVSNGPGDPAAVTPVIDAVRDLLGQIPIFGICLGHQMLAQAAGLRTEKLPFGHRGANHPVRRAADDRVEVTVQNHGYAVVADALPDGVQVTHTSLFDGSVEGVAIPELRAFSVQYHPEASPGPHDARYLFARFVDDHRRLVPRRDDISTILVLGSGPIVIGQAGEFDYSGTQACRALREEGYRVVLVNSNPATIMTDPAVADRTYVEPLDVIAIERVIARERPDALLPTLGGQTALNLAMELHYAGILAREGVELIGATADAIHRAEDRQAFRETMASVGLEMAASVIVTDLEAGLAAAEQIGFPVILRPGFTLGGEGGGVAHDADELRDRLRRALDASPIGQVLLEQSVLGWGEFELEVMRDRNDNAVIICSIENLDPMGVHTGDSVTVAPAMTLTDPELQALRDAALTVIRAVGVETGGSNVQFALNRETGQLLVIEMNPRVSRSSALASKATGFPIAKIAARLAVGYTLDELPNDITKVTPASFEPTLDYVAVKVPRFAFEKVPGRLRRADHPHEERR